MRRGNVFFLFPLALLVLLNALPCLGQEGETQDVIYLKDGRAIKGTIIEKIPLVSVKIQTLEGSIFEFSMDEIDHISVEYKKWRRKSPALAGCLSCLLPSCGQFYNGEGSKGLLIIVGVGTGELLILANLERDPDANFIERLFFLDVKAKNEWPGIGLCLIGGVWIYSVADAIISADRINRESEPAKTFSYVPAISVGISDLSSENKPIPKLSLTWSF